MSVSIQQTDVPASPMSKPPRRLDIDNAKAVAIVLVVIGHISIPQGPAWAFYVRYFIYNFHMPFFMYLSGYVFFLNIERRGYGKLSQYVQTRSKRLLGLFVVMGIIVVNAKYFGRYFGNINRADFDYLDGYKYLILETQNSPSLDLWYLVVLFLFSVLTYVITAWRNFMLYVLLIVGFAMYGLFAITEPSGSLTDDFYISRVCWFYVFFMIGCTTSANWHLFGTVFERLWPAALLGLIASELAAYYGVPGAGSGWRFLICGIFSIVGLHGVWINRTNRMQPLLTYIGQNTLIIYLLNTFVIAATMVALHHAFEPRSHMVQIYLLLTPLGLFVPCLIRGLATQNRATSWVSPYIT